MTPTSFDPTLLVKLERDVGSTLGSHHRSVVGQTAEGLRDLDLDDPGAKLVDDVQQRIHDLFIDTTWPHCPRHGRHPLWFRDGAWWCEQDAVRVAELGALA
jgi:hypothetical protein